MKLLIMAMVRARLTRTLTMINVCGPERVHIVVNVRANVRYFLREKNVVPVLPGRTRA